MNVRERLKEAYENVSFSADRTWSNAPNAYQKNNMVRPCRGVSRNNRQIDRSCT